MCAAISFSRRDVAAAAELYGDEFPPDAFMDDYTHGGHSGWGASHIAEQLAMQGSSVPALASLSE
jgi:hypothetical protein